MKHNFICVVSIFRQMPVVYTSHCFEKIHNIEGIKVFNHIALLRCCHIKHNSYLCILTMHFHALPATLQLFYSLADPSHTVWSMTTLSKQNVHLSKHLNYPYVSFCAPNHSDKTPLSKNQMNRWWRQK